MLNSSRPGDSFAKPQTFKLVAANKTADTQTDCPWTIDPLAPLCEAINLPLGDDCNKMLQWSDISKLQMALDGQLYGIYHASNGSWIRARVEDKMPPDHHRAGMLKYWDEGTCVAAAAAHKVAFGSLGASNVLEHACTAQAGPWATLQALQLPHHVHQSQLPPDASAVLPPLLLAMQLLQATHPSFSCQGRPATSPSQQSVVQTLGTLSSSTTTEIPARLSEALCQWSAAAPSPLPLQVQGPLQQLQAPQWTAPSGPSAVASCCL